MTDHPGELAAQQRAGWTRAGWGSAGVGADLPDVGQQFLARQRLVLIGAADRDGSLWAGPLAGEPGFLRAGARDVRIDARPAAGDPVASALARPADVGMLAIELRTRRRMRINGRSTPTATGIAVHADQVFANCPKYVQRRFPAPDGEEVPQPARHARSLSTQHRAAIAAADTFFVVTAAPGQGVDVSHRGGMPGFVSVLDEQHLQWPDYVGNSMYMTVGNLELRPEAGLLFIDWSSGHTLQLSGHAHVDWDAARAAPIPGAQRIVDFTVRSVVRIDHALPLRWTFGDYFPHNPPARQRPPIPSRPPVPWHAAAGATGRDAERKDDGAR